MPWWEEGVLAPRQIREAMNGSWGAWHADACRLAVGSKCCQCEECGLLWVRVTPYSMQPVGGGGAVLS